MKGTFLANATHSISLESLYNSLFLGCGGLHPASHMPVQLPVHAERCEQKFAECGIRCGGLHRDPTWLQHHSLLTHAQSKVREMQVTEACILHPAW